MGKTWATGFQTDKYIWRNLKKTSHFTQKSIPVKKQPKLLTGKMLVTAWHLYTLLPKQNTHKIPFPNDSTILIILYFPYFFIVIPHLIGLPTRLLNPFRFFISPTCMWKCYKISSTCLPVPKSFSFKKLCFP